MCSTQRSKIKRETFERSTRRSEACNLAKLRYAEGVTSHLDSFWALKDNIFYSYYDFMTLKDIGLLHPQDSEAPSNHTNIY